MKSGFGQFCPVAVACEVFGERWTPMILRELLAGSHRFNQIQRGIPLISRPLLAQRLRDLEIAGVIISSPASAGRGREYRLTDAGMEFRAVIEALGVWGQRWTVRVNPHNLDAGVLMWNIRRRILVERLPAQRVIVRFDYRGIPSGHRSPTAYWLELEPPHVELCVSDPGFEVDLYVDADLAAMVKVWLGDVSLASVLRSKEVRLTGPRSLVATFHSWFPLSAYAAVPRPHASSPC
jgi:DNA-binding HxlR family transcriptional regulator